MGYSHGTQWTEEKIIKKIKEIMEKTKIKTMPSRNLMKEITGNNGLCSAISRKGGFMYFANKMGLQFGKCETFYGRKFEELCSNDIKNMFGYETKLMKVGYPYDILANGIKIDVKVSKLNKTSNGFYAYTCNLGKKYPTCDIFICYCVDVDDKIKKTYIIPSCFLIGHTQITFGESNSKYDDFKNNWELLEIYNEFNKKVSLWWYSFNKKGEKYANII